MTALECRVVLLRRFGGRAAADFELLLSKAGVRIWPFDEAQADAAFFAYKRFGRGSGHAAKLNLVDCAGYALATTRY